MARPLRIEYPGALYRLTFCGDSQDDIFLDDADRWDVGRDLGNIAAHPDDQMIFAPGQALGQLDTTMELINRLFANRT